MKYKNTPIGFDLFRQKYSIPAAAARGIIKDVGLDVIRDGANQYIVGDSELHSNNEYLLKHAVLEWRATMDIKNTLSKNFLEFDIVGDEVKGLVGISTITEEMIEPKTPSQKKKPNKPSGNILIKATDLVKIENEMVDAAESELSAHQASALSALVSALRALPQTNQPQDILKPQKALLEASEAGFRLTTEQLSELLGLSRQTVASRKSGFIKLGFIFDKVKEGSSTLWKVRQVP